MIDTIVLRVHDVAANYQNLVDFLMSDKKGLEFSHSLEKPTTYLNFKYLHFADTERYDIQYRTTIQASSNYDMQVSYWQSKDFVEFSYSIPKYLFGTNVLQFTKHYSQGIIDLAEESDMSFLYDRAFKMLGDHIRTMFKTALPISVDVDLKHVEIKRIDFCYNQIFDNRDDALQYLYYQKLIKKNGARRSTTSMQNYETSIFYHTEYYAAKIYHKGTEWKKNDRLKLLAINKKARKKRECKLFDKGLTKDEIREAMLNFVEPFPIDEIYNLAERTLRYEISFKKSFLAYYYWRYYWGKDEKQWQELTTKQRDMENEYRRAVNKKEQSDRAKGLKDYRRNWSKQDFTDKVNVEKLYNFAPLFMMKGGVDDYDYPVQSGKVVIERRQKFNKFLWSVMRQKFFDFIENFRVEQKVYMNDASDKILAYNREQKFLKETGQKSKTIKAGSMRKMNLLLQHYSMDELRELGTIPKSTFYYWKKQLKKIGIEKNNVSSVEIKTCLGNEQYLNVVEFSQIRNLIKD